MRGGFKSLEMLLSHKYKILLPFVPFLAVSIFPSSSQLFPAGPLPQVFDEPASCARGSQFYQPGDLSCLTCGLNQQTSSDGKKTIPFLLMFKSCKQ